MIAARFDKPDDRHRLFRRRHTDLIAGFGLRPTVTSPVGRALVCKKGPPLSLIESTRRLCLRLG